MDAKDIKKVDINNAIVRVSGGNIDSSGVVEFLYPRYEIKDEICFDYEHDIIFTGKYKMGLKNELSHGTRNFIAVCSSGMFDFDLTERGVLLGIICNKWDKILSENTLNALENMSDTEFMDFFKKYWVLGHSKLEDKGKSLYSLYNTLGKQRYDILKTYYELHECYTDTTIFNSVLSFIEKSLNPDTITSQNGRYIKLLEDFSKSYRGRIVPIIQRAYTMPGNKPSDKEYRTLWVLMQLGRGNIL